MSDPRAKTPNWIFEKEVIKSITNNKDKMFQTGKTTINEPHYSNVMSMLYKVQDIGKTTCRWCSGFGHSHKFCPTRERITVRNLCSGKLS